MRILIEKDDGERVPVKAIEACSPDSPVILLHSSNYLRQDDIEGIEKIMSEKRGRHALFSPLESIRCSLCIDNASTWKGSDPMSTNVQTATAHEAIVISRDGSLVRMPQLSQEQVNALWEQIVRNYAQRHPEIFRDASV